jgi:hypothetical protein
MKRKWDANRWEEVLETAAAHFQSQLERLQRCVSSPYAYSQEEQRAIKSYFVLPKGRKIVLLDLPNCGLFLGESKVTPRSPLGVTETFPSQSIPFVSLLSSILYSVFSYAASSTHQTNKCPIQHGQNLCNIDYRRKEAQYRKKANDTITEVR